MDEALARAPGGRRLPEPDLQAGRRRRLRAHGAQVLMPTVHLRVKRYNPETDRKPHWQEFSIEAEPTDRILDALHTAKWTLDGTLSFRRSCAHGVCGSDAMVINGANGLACQELIKDVGTE